MEIPYEKLEPRTLDAVIESFVLREGTDYGASEVSLATKVEQVHRALRDGRARMCFDPDTETLTIERVSS